MPQSPAIPDTQGRDRLAVALTWLFRLTFLALAVALYTARLHNPGPSAGEFWSDSNVINASRGFDQAGFTATWGLPRIQTAAPVDDTSALYLSYPPGPYWLTYTAWRAGKLLNIDPLLTARLFAQTCGLASALLFTLVATRLSRSKPIGALAGLFYILSPAFLAYSAALHHMAYSPMLLFGAMLAWLAFEDSRGPRRLVPLALTAILFSADCWTNLEHMFFFALFVGVRTAFHFRLPVILGAALVGPLPIPMMVLRVLHNAQVLGGWDIALEKFRARASSRSGGGRLGVDLTELALSWAARLDFPVTSLAHKLNWNQEFVYPALHPLTILLALALLASIALHKLARPPRPRLALSLVDPAVAILPLHDVGDAARAPRFLFWTLRAPPPTALALLGGLTLLTGGLTWFVVMTQHTQPHRFIVLLLMPGLSLLLAALAWSAIASARAATAHATGLGATLLRARATLLILLLLTAFAWSTRRADVLNQLTPLHDSTHRRTTRLTDSNAAVASLGHALRDLNISRVHLYDGANVMPWRAASINLPFLYARITLPESLLPHDALYLEAWDSTEATAALDAAQRFSLPDPAAPIDTRALVYLGQRPPAEADFTLAAPLLPPSSPGSAPLTLDSFRWSEPLTHHEFTLVLLITGDLASMTDADLARLVFILRLHDDQGRQLLDTRTRLRWSPIRDDDRALLFLTAPADTVAAATRAQMLIWDRQDQRAVPLPVPSDPRLSPAADNAAVSWPIATPDMPSDSP